MKIISDNSFLNISKQEKEKFYKKQFKYYRGFNTGIVIISVLASLTYFISDCQLFGRFANETLIPRISILIPFSIFLLLRKLNLDYKVEMIASQYIGHSIMWHTIWAIVYLPNRQYASDGFLIMQLVMLMLGFASSFEVAAISQLMIIVNILISNTFNHYEDLNLMLSLGIPCALGIAISNYIFTQSYYEAYLANTKLENLSYIDQLTGVFNRHKLDEITDGDKLKRYNLQDISFIILDIDFFKKINDTYGHDKGDIILKDLADILKNNVKDAGFVIRWGGEEFLIILYGYNEKNAYTLAEKIRQDAENKDNSIDKITVSLGICEYDFDSYKNTVKKADIALYKAKELGRNKTIKYSSIS